MEPSAGPECQSIDKNTTMASLTGSEPQCNSPNGKRNRSEQTYFQFAPQLNVTSKFPVASHEAEEDSPRTAIARQLQDFRIKGPVPQLSFGQDASVPPPAKRSKHTYDVQRQPRVRHTAVFRRRPSSSDATQRHQRSSSAPPPSERLGCPRVTTSALVHEHNRPLNYAPIFSPAFQSASPRYSPPAISSFTASNPAKAATSSPSPSSWSIMRPFAPSIASPALQPVERPPLSHRPPPIFISPSSTGISTSQASKSLSHEMEPTSPSPQISNQSTTQQILASNLPVPFSPTSPLSPTALTWKPAEITGHLISQTLDTPDDDGYGINGLGFKPSPQLARARQMRRRQQVTEWREREAREARIARWRKRDAKPGSGVDGVSEVGGGGMKRVVRFA